MLAKKQMIPNPIEIKLEKLKTWAGNITGLQAERKLKKSKYPYRFILREGESDMNYYITFVLPDLTIKHQPFAITVAADCWYWETCDSSGSYTHESFENVIHLIMNCDKEECVPFTIQKNEDTQLFFDFHKHS